MEVTDRLLSVHTSVAWIMRTALCITQEVKFMQRWLFYTVVCAFAIVVSGTGSVIAGQLSLVSDISKCIPTLGCFGALFALVALLTPLHVRQALEHAALRSTSITNSSTHIKQVVHVVCSSCCYQLSFEFLHVAVGYKHPQTPYSCTANRPP